MYAKDKRRAGRKVGGAKVRDERLREVTLSTQRVKKELFFINFISGMPLSRIT